MRRHALIAALVLAIVNPFMVNPLEATASRAYHGCRFDNLTLLFGQYDVFNHNPTPIAGDLTYVCSHVDDDVKISLSAGQSRDYRNRYMTNASDASQHLRYQLSLNPDCTRAFGDGFEDSDDLDIDGRKGSGTVHVFGVVYPRQDVSAGRYSDELEVTINY